MLFSRAPNKSLLRNGDRLIKIAAFVFGPIQHDPGGGDLGQAADLAFVLRLLLLQNVAGARIDNDK